MALEYDGAVIAGKAYFMVAEPGTPCPDPETINPHEVSQGFEGIGEVSADNIFSLEMEGGEIVNKPSHANPTFRTRTTPMTWKLNANSLMLASAKVLNLVFNGVHDPSKNKFTVRNGSSNAKKAVFVLIDDDGVKAGLYFSKTNVNLGAVPTFAIDGYSEVPIKFSILEDPVSGDIFDFIHPNLGNVAGATTAELSTTVSATGKITKVTVINGGTGYTTAPTITFSGGGATTQATVTAEVANGRITSVTIVDGGAGYTSDPEVTITR